MRLPGHRLAALLPVLALASALAPARVVAQDSGRGFLFGAPKGHVGVRGGLAVPSAGSDIYSFSFEELTLDRSDFNAASLAVDLGLRLSPQLELVISGAFARRSARSEFRDWVDQDDLPIEQTTTLSRTPLTAGLRYYLAPTGRSVGRYAWIPARFTPFVGAGGGILWYSFEQSGDFVDFNSLDVFTDRFTSTGATGTVHALAGIDISLNPRMALTSQARYEWARGELGRDFSGFEKIDLSGFTATMGISFRY